MTTLIAADVFGPTPELQAFAAALDQPTRVIGPSESPAPAAWSEAMAYASFIDGGGIPPYVHRLEQVLSDPAAGIERVIGFSVGAAALWALLATLRARSIRSATLFYGSRIRDQLDRVPLCPVQLVFAEHEKSFCPSNLVATLRARGHDAVLDPGSQHGFMNRRSPGFDPARQAKYLEALRSTSPA